MERTLPVLRPMAIRWRILLDVAPWIGLAWFAWFLGGFAQGGDARIEYAVTFPPDYSLSDIRTATFNYSPAFAFWIQPFQMLPFQVFLTAIIAAELVVLAWLVTPWIALMLVVVQMPTIYRELLEGQFNLLVAAGAVLAFRYAGLYAPMLLTKATPGVGLVWFAVRREWRSLAIALGITLAVSLPSMVLAPETWVEWVRTSLITNSSRLDSSMPLAVRGVVAIAFIAWGAKTDRPWVVPIAIGMASGANFIGWLAALGSIRLFAGHDESPPLRQEVPADAVLVARAGR